MYKMLSAVALSALLCACGGGGSGAGSSAGSASGTYTAASGVAQKGPLIKGSTVTAQELNAMLSPTGKQYTFQVNSDLGTFSPTSSFGSQYIGLTATGYYFDEVAGAVSGSTVTLEGVSDLSTDPVLNVNLLTTLAYPRVVHLVTVSGLSVSAARAQAESEVLAALHIPASASVGSFGSLDLSKGSDGDKMLAAISSLFVYGHTAGQLSSLIASFQSDLADNGVIDSAATRTALATASAGLDPAAVAGNLTTAYTSLGITFTATDISNWIDQDGDGVVGKYRFLASGSAPSTVYTSGSYVVGATEAGKTFSVSAGTLLVNGVATSGSSVTAQAGDTLAIRLTSGATAATRVSSYLSEGSQHVAAFIVSVPGLNPLAGNVSQSGSADGAAASASFNAPYGLASDSSGNVYVADEYNNTIRMISPAGVVTTLAGTAGVTGSTDGFGTSTLFNDPSGLAVDSAGNVYVADTNNSTIRKITPTGTVTTLAGTAGVTGTTDGTGSAARFNHPNSVAVDNAGNVYVADSVNDTIRKITPAGVVTTLAGVPGIWTYSGTLNSTGAATFNNPMGIAVDSVGNVYVAETGNNAIRKISADGTVTTLARATSSITINQPIGVAVGNGGMVYVTNYADQTLLQITPAGVVTTVVGASGQTGNQLGALPGLVTQPVGVTVLPSGLLAFNSGNAIIEASLQ